MSPVRPPAWDTDAPMPRGVALVGATGSVGQRFVERLEGHPWFRLEAVAASAARRGQRYGASVDWYLPSALPERVGALPLITWEELDLERTPLVFSALPSGAARVVEPELARRGFWVVTNASAHRMEVQVPLLVPEVNRAHLDLLRTQAGPGALVAGPNCSTAGLVLALAPLQRRFGLEAVLVTTMQAHSGAGLPGVLGPLAEANVLPHIAGEEDKLESEPNKILGTWVGDRIEPLAFPISATCNRVPVVDGHTECVSVRLTRRAGFEELLAAWREFPGLDLPSAPAAPVEVLLEDLAPNPKEHVQRHGGMCTLIGQVRPCPVLDWKFTLLSHNTLRGAAGGAILIGESCVRWAER